MSVVLPAPFGPISATDPPASTTPFTPRSTGSRSYAAATGSRTRAGAIPDIISSQAGNDLLGVVGFHLQIGVGVAAVRAEGVAVERLRTGHDLHAGFAGDGLGRLRRQRALRKHRLHPFSLDLGYE